MTQEMYFYLYSFLFAVSNLFLGKFMPNSEKLFRNPRMFFIYTAVFIGISTLAWLPQEQIHKMIDFKNPQVEVVK